MNEPTCFSVGQSGGCGAACPVFIDGDCTEPQEIAREYVVEAHGEAASGILAQYPCFEERADIPAPPVPVVDTAMLGGSGYARNENDFYPTEPPATQVIVDFFKEHFPWVRKVWEPACGAGDMTRVLRQTFQVIDTDKFPQGSGLDDEEQAELSFDFLVDAPIFSFDAGITNPPYGDLAEEFAKRCVEYARELHTPMALLMRNEWDCAKSRKYLLGDCPLYYAKVVLLWRPRWIADSTGSPRHNYAWYIWAPGRHGDPKVYYASKPSLA